MEKPTPDQMLIKITDGMASCWSARNSSGLSIRFVFSR